MITLAQTLGQLRRIADQQRFTATRVGTPGCRVRLEAADNIEALMAAINLLEGLRPSAARAGTRVAAGSEGEAEAPGETQ